MTPDPPDDLSKLIRAEWNPANTYDLAPACHTGWYDTNRGGQQITVTNPDESVINGGETGFTSLRGDGSPSQLWGGEVYVNTWAGTREDCRGLHPDGGDLNPKALATALRDEATRIIDAHADGDLDGENVFNTLAVARRRGLADTDGPATVFRWELRLLYTYD